MLTRVADGVWVRQSEWVWTNSVIVRGEDGLVLVDPGIDGSELNQLADDLDRLGIPVVAGFSTHPHWDHLLWHARFGDVPRYATPAGAHAAGEARRRAQAMAAESASGIPLELIALVTPLPADGGPVPGEIIVHEAHAVGHAAVLLADRGVLLAGDMLSDVLIPLLDRRRSDQASTWLHQGQLPLPGCVGQVGHPLGRLRAERLQGHAARVHALEQADSGAEQHG